MSLPAVKDLLEKDLFELLEIQDATDEKKRAILESLTNKVEAQIIARVSGMLSEEDAKKFSQLAEEGESEQIVDFLVEKEIDLPVIVSEESTRARVEIVELVRLAKEK